MTTAHTSTINYSSIGNFVIDRKSLWVVGDAVLDTRMNVEQNQSSIYSRQIEGMHLLRGLSAAQPN